MSGQARKFPQGGSELARDLTTRPRVGYAALRSHRWSSPGARYFVTFCTADRRTGLHLPPILAGLQRECSAIEDFGGWVMRASVVMPDHVHLLLALGEKLSLGQVIARVKAKTSPKLRVAQLRWEAGYFERRLRESDSVLPIIHYLGMNPVRAGLVSEGEEWPGFWCRAEDRRWYEENGPGAGTEADWLSFAEGVGPRRLASKLAPTSASGSISTSRK